MTRTHRDTLAASGAAAAQYRGSALGFHAGAEAMRLHSAMAVGLECALGHRDALLFPSRFSSRNFALSASINSTGSCVRNPAPSQALSCDPRCYEIVPSRPALKMKKNVRQPEANAAVQTQKIGIHLHLVRVTSAPLVISFTTIGATLFAVAKVM